MREALAGLIDILDKAKIRRLRLVRPSAIHLTLKFLAAVVESGIKHEHKHKPRILEEDIPTHR